MHLSLAVERNECNTRGSYPLRGRVWAVRPYTALFVHLGARVGRAAHRPPLAQRSECNTRGTYPLREQVCAVRSCTALI